MASELPEFEVDSEGEYLTTTDSEGEGTDVARARLLFREENATVNSGPWYARIFHRRFNSKRAAPLSVQSGDISRTPTPTEQSSVATSPRSGEDNNVDNGKSGFYKFLFPKVHFLVKGVFFSSKCPIVPFVLLLLNVLVVVAFAGVSFGVYTPSVNFNIESFRIPDHPAQIHWDSFQAAINDRISNQTSSSADFLYSNSQAKSLKKLDLNLKKSFEKSFNIEKSLLDDCNHFNQDSQHTMHLNWYMDLVYRVPQGNSDQNILSEERLRYIHEVEDHIFNLPDYKDFCHKPQPSQRCDRLTSILSWLYPTKSDGSYVYNTADGFTPDLTASLLSLKSNLSIALWFTGGQVTLADDNSKVSGTLLRSQVRIGLPLPCYTSHRDRYDEQHDRVDQFFISLIPYIESASTDEVEVLYGGNSVFDYQIQSAIVHDAKLAIASGIMILILIFMLSGFSAWFTLCGVYTILSCFPFAFFVYRVIFQIESIGLLNVISLFVIIGIGVDDVFVFLNTFKQSASLEGLDTIHKRLTHTIISAGKATFFTSVTTAVAFFANAISSIPAVKQFGLFMGLVVLFCYIQVTIVLPLFLHLYHWCLLPCENLCYLPLVHLFSSCTSSPLPSDLPPVRYNAIDMSEEDDDSGIDILGNQNSQDSSERSSTDSGASDSNVTYPSGGIGMEPSRKSGSNTGAEIEPRQTPKRTAGDNETQRQSEEDDGERDNRTTLILKTRTTIELETLAGPSAIVSDTETLFNPVLTSTSTTTATAVTAESHVTYLLQVFMLKFVARLVMFPRTCKPRCFANVKFGAVFRFFSRYAFVWVYLVIIVSTFTAMCFLRPTESPPQIFNPNTNIQKMLNLAGNLTEAESYNCVTCNPTYSGGGVPIPTVRPTSHTPSHTPSNTPSQRPSTNPPPPTNPPPTNPPRTNPPPTNPPPVTDPPSQATTAEATHPPPHSTTDRPTTHAVVTTHPRPPHATTSEPTSSHSTSVTPTTSSGNGNGGSGPGHVQQSSRFSNNVVVYVVFGLAGVQRKYNPSHVLPEEGEGDYAVLDREFHNSFTCPLLPGTSASSLRGTIRALCRLCANFSNPDNGLTLPGNSQCLHPSLLRSYSCLVGDQSDLQGCIQTDTSNVSVAAKAETDSYRDGSQSVRYMAMAFRSTTYPGSSPFTSINDYQIWEDFLARELEEIKQHSGEGEFYDGASDLISTAFQTSESWVEINVEMVAVWGSIYGILISVILCLVVVVILSHNWRIVASMCLTIFAILTTLLALFRIFGWKIGIVEAISLSILVGNSLDYCIHLTEGYISSDTRHLAFVERFKFAAGASVRVKRVMASISFIGVSIVSSAITTILAVIPLLGTQIQLFTRFGQILLLDTFIAIVYTLVFCSTFLSFFGPTQFRFTTRKLVNAVVTIVGTLVAIGLVVLAVVIAAKAGVRILSPNGGVLFQ